jgi:hypothetical protein
MPSTVTVDRGTEANPAPITINKMPREINT